MTNFMKETLTAVADRIMAGYRLQKDDAIVQEMLTLPLEDLQREAGRLQKHFCGNHVDFCTIINAQPAGAKTANTAPRPPAIIRTVKNTAFCPKKKL